MIRSIVAVVALLFAAPLAARQVPLSALKVTETPQGGYVLGNPQAKIRLVEYASFTCSHCAHFANTGATSLKRDYVAKGLVAYEVRNAARDPFYDTTIALLARCGGPRKFFGNMEALFANQESWFAAVQKLDKAPLEKAGPAGAAKLMVEGTGLKALMLKRGFTAVQINQCLSDNAAAAKIKAMTDDAFVVRKISGTPAFFINDQLAENAVTYEQLEPFLKATVNLVKP